MKFRQTMMHEDLKTQVCLVKCKRKKREKENEPFIIYY